MNFVEFIFALIERLVPMREGRHKELLFRCSNWYERVILGKPITNEGQTIPDFEPQEGNFLVKLLRKWGEDCWTQTGLAVFFIFAFRMAHDFMNPSKEDDDDK